VPQGSILGPLLFNIFINDIFLFIEKCEICNFADDNTIYSCHKSLNTILENLSNDMEVLLDWFKINSLKANPDKFQFMILGSTEKPHLVLNSIILKPDTEVILLGITIDNRLTFENHISKLCRTASYKLHALRRIRSYISEKKAKELCSAFINSQFNYSSLIWMFCRKTVYSKLENLHYKTLRVVYQSSDSYEELLSNRNEISIHQRHLRFLLTEIYKAINNQSPDFMRSFFIEKEMSYNLRKGKSLVLPKANSSYFGINSLRFRSAMLWNNIPEYLKCSKTVAEFKCNLKAYGNIDCTCLICR